MSEMVVVGLHNGDPDNERWQEVLAHGVLHELRAEDVLLSSEFQLRKSRSLICGLLTELVFEGNRKRQKLDNGVAVLPVLMNSNSGNLALCSAACLLSWRSKATGRSSLFRSAQRASVTGRCRSC
jgi:hypothetical protein